MLTTCLTTRNSQKEKRHWKAPSFVFSKSSGSSFHSKELQSYSTKYEPRSRVNAVPFWKARKERNLLLIFFYLYNDLYDKRKLKISIFHTNTFFKCFTSILLHFWMVFLILVIATEWSHIFFPCTYEFVCFFCFFFRI